MQLRLKRNIENRIFYPFLSVFFLFTVLFGGILYYNSYQSLLGQSTAVANLILEGVSEEIEQYGEEFGEQRILTACGGRGDTGLMIREPNGRLLLGNYAEEMADPWELSSRSDNRFGWQLSYRIDRQDFYNTLLESQKYLLLATVALLIITVQASVFVAYNISEPIRRLSAFCVRVSRAPQQVGKEIPLEDYVRRGDEIGELALAFDRMLSDLRGHTDEILRVKQLNESIVENLPLGVVAYSVAGEQLCINSKALALLESQTKEVQSNEPLFSVIGGWMDTGRLLVDPLRVQDGSGRVMDLEVGIWRLTDSEGFDWGALCTLDDITYKKMMEEKYSQSEKLAYTGQVAADLAHEIRNPLAGIRAGMQVISRRLSPEGDHALCDSMIGEVDRINLLIENLLNLARQRVSHKTNVSVGRLLGEIALLYTKVAENSRIELHFSHSEGLSLYADEGEIKQVLINLINNSFKAIGTGGEVSVCAFEQEGALALTVQDDGVGMTEQELQTVLNKQRTSTTAGRGLGLSIVSRLLIQNGGRFSIESHPGEGTTITILFEREQPDEV